MPVPCGIGSLGILKSLPSAVNDYGCRIFVQFLIYPYCLPVQQHLASIALLLQIFKPLQAIAIQLLQDLLIHVTILVHDLQRLALNAICICDRRQGLVLPVNDKFNIRIRYQVSILLKIVGHGHMGIIQALNTKIHVMSAGRQRDALCFAGQYFRRKDCKFLIQPQGRIFKRYGSCFFRFLPFFNPLLHFHKHRF